jgi:hypothetical protein
MLVIPSTSDEGQKEFAVEQTLENDVKTKIDP